MSNLNDGEKMFQCQFALLTEAMLSHSHTQTPDIAARRHLKNWVAVSDCHKHSPKPSALEITSGAKSCVDHFHTQLFLFSSLCVKIQQGTCVVRNLSFLECEMRASHLTFNC